MNQSKNISISLEAYNGPNNYAFISYCQQDKENVYKILKILALNNIRFWFDKSFNFGEDWEELARTKITHVKCIFHLIFLTDNSINSSAVQKELEWSEQNKDLKRIYFLFNQKLKNAIPPKYKNILYADLSNPSMESELIEKMVRSLSLIIENNETFNDPIPIYEFQSASNFIAIVDRKDVHKFPYWHKTSNIIVMWDKKNCFMKIKQSRAKKPVLTLGFWGGHTRLGEENDPKLTALQELTEELNLPFFSIKEKDLVQVFERDSFPCKLRDKKEKWYNFENSTYFIYYIPDELKELVHPMEQNINDGTHYDVSASIFPIEEISLRILQPSKFLKTDKIAFSDDVLRLFEIKDYRPPNHFQEIIKKYLS